MLHHSTLFFGPAEFLEKNLTINKPLSEILAVLLISSCLFSPVFFLNQNSEITKKVRILDASVIACERIGGSVVDVKVDDKFFGDFATHCRIQERTVNITNTEGLKATPISEIKSSLVQLQTLSKP